MGAYRIAEVCPNGHVSTHAADVHSELREKGCSHCGEATMTHCPECAEGICGYHAVEGFISLMDDYQPPAFSPFRYRIGRIQ
jgi:hypothetical protein